MVMCCDMQETWSYSLVVRTSDFESGNPGSNPGRTFFFYFFFGTTVGTQIYRHP
jgi:hypothetical protein